VSTQAGRRQGISTCLPPHFHPLLAGASPSREGVSREAVGTGAFACPACPHACMHPYRAPCSLIHRACRPIARQGRCKRMPCAWGNRVHASTHTRMHAHSHACMYAFAFKHTVRRGHASANVSRRLWPAPARPSSLTLSLAWASISTPGVVLL